MKWCPHTLSIWCLALSCWHLCGIQVDIFKLLLRYLDSLGSICLNCVLFLSLVGQINKRHLFLQQLTGVESLKKEEVESFDNVNYLHDVVLVSFVTFGILEGLLLFVYITKVQFKIDILKPNFLFSETSLDFNNRDSLLSCFLHCWWVETRKWSFEEKEWRDEKSKECCRRRRIWGSSRG